MNHNHKPCFRTKQGLFYLFDVMGMFGTYGTTSVGYPSGAFVAARSAGTRHTGATFVSPCGKAP